MTVEPSHGKKSNEPMVVRCQKCLEYGHWTYECKNKRKIVLRESRTVQLNKRLKIREELLATAKLNSETSKVNESKRQKSKRSPSSSSSSSSSDSSSSDSSSSSSSSASSVTSSSSDSSSDSDSSDT